MLFLYQITAKQICMSSRQYHDVTIAANVAAIYIYIYTMFSTPKKSFDSYSTQILRIHL